jgi:hypothetical protein
MPGCLRGGGVVVNGNQLLLFDEHRKPAKFTVKRMDLDEGTARRPF